MPYKYQALFTSAHELRLYLIQNPDVVAVLMKKYWDSSERNPLIDLCTNPLWAAETKPESLSANVCAEMAKVLLQEFEVNPNVYTYLHSNNNEGKRRSEIWIKCNAFNPQEERERNSGYPTAFLACALNTYPEECRILKLMLEAGVASDTTITITNHGYDDCKSLDAVEYATKYGPSGAGAMVKSVIKEHENVEANSDAVQGLLNLMQNAPSLKKQLADAKELTATLDKMKADYAKDMKDYNMEVESLELKLEKLSKQKVIRKKDHEDKQAVLMASKGFMAEKQIKAVETKLEALTSIKAFIQEKDRSEQDSGEEYKKKADSDACEKGDEARNEQGSGERSDEQDKKADLEHCQEGNEVEFEMTYMKPVRHFAPIKDDRDYSDVVNLSGTASPEPVPVRAREDSPEPVPIRAREDSF